MAWNGQVLYGKSSTIGRDGERYGERNLGILYGCILSGLAHFHSHVSLFIVPPLSYYAAVLILLCLYLGQY